MLGLYWGYIGIMENQMETAIMGLGCRVIVTFKWMESGFGYIIIRSPYTPYSIYSRGTIGVGV